MLSPRKHPRPTAPLALATLAVVAALATGACGPPGPDAHPEGAPDVLVIVLDTLRPDHLGCYGYGRPSSPNIDAFAATATVFEQAESASPWTAPALISLMTSLHPEVHGVYQFPNPGRLNERVETLAERLSARGYATGAFTEGGYAKAEFGLDQGFDVYPSNEGDDDSHRSNLDHESRLEGNLDRALAWYAEHADRPRFLFFHTYEIHEPLRAPDEYVRLFRPGWDSAAEDARLEELLERFDRARSSHLARDVSERMSFDISPAEAQLVFNHWHHCITQSDLPEGFQLHLTANGLIPEGGMNHNADKLEFFRDLYDAGIRYTDDQLQRLFEVVDDGDLVVIVSDHGEAIGEHGLIGHGSRFHREQIGVALIVRAPAESGLAPGRCSLLVRSVDVQPTVLELCGLSDEDLAQLPIQGRSLVPLMRGGALDARPSLSHGLSQSSAELSFHSVRDGKLRLIRSDQTGELQLYDLANDPGETRNLAGDEPQRAAELARVIEHQLASDRELFRVLSGQTGDVRLTPDLLRDLRGLGYVGGDEDTGDEDTGAE